MAAIGFACLLAETSAQVDGLTVEQHAVRIDPAAGQDKGGVRQQNAACGKTPVRG
ncbi:hypothetical protein [Parvularcula lutaonensis]|uniref:hypothetical protein n=1 Tax=Parvularcula lutaonensis TaxID=491923 RepID=UPI001E2C4D95|nr:hypothetical protein [Parvularcula lutaonensis]